MLFIQLTSGTTQHLNQNCSSAADTPETPAFIEYAISHLCHLWPSGRATTSPSTSHRRFLLVREEFSACLNKSSQEVAAPGFGAIPGRVFSCTAVMAEVTLVTLAQQFQIYRPVKPLMMFAVKQRTHDWLNSTPPPPRPTNKNSVAVMNSTVLLQMCRNVLLLSATQNNPCFMSFVYGWSWLDSLQHPIRSLSRLLLQLVLHFKWFAS